MCVMCVRVERITALVMWTRHLSACAGTSSVWAVSTRDVIKHCTVLPDAVLLRAGSCVVCLHISHQTTQEPTHFITRIKRGRLGFYSAERFLRFLERLVGLQQSMKNRHDITGCGQHGGINWGVTSVGKMNYWQLSASDGSNNVWGIWWDYYYF